MGFVNSVASHLNEILWDLYVFNGNCSRFVDVKIKFKCQAQMYSDVTVLLLAFPNVIKIDEHSNKNLMFHKTQIVRKQRFFNFSLYQMAGRLITEVIMSTETQQHTVIHETRWE